MKSRFAIMRWACLALVTVGATAPAMAQEAAPPPNVAEANERVGRAETLFQQGDYDGALAEFEEAYRVIGDHPARFIILYNIGQAHERRFRYDLAITYYQRYLDEGGPNAPEREEVRASLGALQRLLATVQITVNVPSAQVWVDDRQLGEAPGDVLVTGGRHVVELRADGYQPARQEIQIAPQTTQSLDFSMTESFAGLDPAVFWIFAGTTVAVALAGAGVGIQTLLRRGEVDQQLMDPARRYLLGDAEREQIETLALTTDILFGSALLLGATAIVLALLTKWEEGGDAETQASSPFRLTPFAGPTGGGAAMEVVW